MGNSHSRPQYALRRDDLGKLVDTLVHDGWEVVAPVVGEDTMVYDRIERAADLPRGYREEQKAGQYRLECNAGDRWFDHTVGPHAPKRHLFPAHLDIWTVERTKQGMSWSEPEPPPRTALFGIRSCDVTAIEVQSRVFNTTPREDVHYRRRRERIFVVAVQCTRPAANCFCGAMNSGPRCGEGADIILTEGADHFLVEIATEAAARLTRHLHLKPAADVLISECDDRLQAAATVTRERFVAANVPELLTASADSSHWNDVAERCLACGNCALVCPTCACADIRDHSSIDGATATRERVWDVCFTPEFSYLFGAPFRQKIASRYRHWVTHKFAHWHEQYGRSGCVGCGRCITWCPVGIDVTEEILGLREHIGEGSVLR